MIEHLAYFRQRVCTGFRAAVFNRYVSRCGWSFDERRSRIRALSVFSGKGSREESSGCYWADESQEMVLQSIVGGFCFEFDGQQGFYVAVLSMCACH